ncbi:hypothetical protein NIES37_41690 [Tolypothrix tenuis PCC 7101]|uniref:LRAT domain-containing protein n=1 Tax=Tolypothrix tenuis PCC 7101 TaxID=231146 RepID=A0A1Z4N3C8_9CYAN|nr:lecithin retinol acyltransferase family protein [Aulosira sp. FACHB-113]BAZ00181.1 hypothetical protein NIES37_41690 [Tolypothrix tenuis PCC 7101]BAZ75898.1 hypothetical protein NIES50_44900 [Aulosira laxa NIES-50]
MNSVDIIPGDHIFYRCGTHDHHGIYCGDIPYKNKIYHNVVIHFEGKFKRGQIRGVSFEKFAKGHNIYVVQYKKGSCYYNNLVLDRAINKLGEPDYNLFGNNCEHFAHWCKTGTKRCGQLHNFIEEAGGILGGAIAGGVAGAVLPLTLPEVVIIGVCLAAGFGGSELGKRIANLFSDQPDYEEG